MSKKFLGELGRPQPQQQTELTDCTSTKRRETFTMPSINPSQRLLQEDSDSSHSVVYKGQSKNTVGKKPEIRPNSQNHGTKAWLSGSQISDILQLFTPCRNQILSHIIYDVNSTCSPRLVQDQTLILAPLLVNNNHWVLTSIEWEETRSASFCFYDSLKASSKTIRELMKRAIARLPSLTLQQPAEMDCAAQTNNHDCGIHVIVNGVCLLLDMDPLEHLDSSWWRLFLGHVAQTYGSEISPLVAGKGLVNWGDTESTVPAEARYIEFLETGKIVHAELHEAKKKVGESLCAYATHCRESKNELADLVKALKSLDQELSSLRQTCKANQEQLILYQGLLDTAARLGHGQRVIDVNQSEVQISQLQKEIGKQNQRLDQVELRHREAIERKLELETHSSSRRSAAVKCLLRMERANKAMAELRRCDAKRKRGDFSEGRDGEGRMASGSQQPSHPTNLCRENWRGKTENGEIRRSRRTRKH